MAPGKARRAAAPATPDIDVSPRYARRGRMSEFLQSDRGMRWLLDKHVGAGRWTYDPLADRWVYPTRRGADGARRYAVFERGGDWHVEALPDGAIQ